MPRETIFSPYPHDPASGPLPFQMQVGWQRDMDVQVGISTHDDRHLVDYVYASEETSIGRSVWDRLHELAPEAFKPLDFKTSDQEDEFFKKVGRETLDSVTGSTPFGTSVWWNPGRVQINQFIRLLRKARDAAYGRDE